MMRYSRCAALAAMMLATTSCSLVGGDDEPAAPDATGGDPGTVVLLTHSSFYLPDDLVTAFEQDTGLKLELRSNGDAGEVTNRLVLTRDNPAGDVVFGVDNAFASR